MPATAEGARVARIHAAASDVSETELGAPGVMTVGGWLDTWEDAPDLRFPVSAVMYDKMRRDPQVDGILRAIFLPVRTALVRSRLTGDDVNPAVMEYVRTELGLNDDTGGRQRRRRQGISFVEVIRHALLSLVFGFMPLEQVYEVGPPAPGQENLDGLPLLLAHLRKLGPRMPRSLTAIDVARDGGLNAIKQHVPRGNGQPGWDEVTIPVDRLVMFCNDREGGDWTGRSILRSSYGPWLIKNRLTKIAALIVERNGLGVPVTTGREDQRADGLRLAKAVRAGAEAGAFLPDGMTLRLVGVEGRTVDPIPLIQYFDQTMGRAALAMFLNLGHDNGARALGDTFVDIFTDAGNTVADDLADTITEHVIRDLVEVNFGPDEAYPILTPDPIAAEGTPTAEALKALSDGGLLGVIDEDLVREVRRRHGLPMSKVEVIDPNAVVPGTAVPPAEEVELDPAAMAARALAVSERLAALAARS